MAGLRFTDLQSARWSSWISPAWRSTSFSSLSCPSRPHFKPGWRRGGWMGTADSS